MPKAMDPKDQLIVDLGSDHRLAHQVLFAHRHPDATPAFHYEIIDDLHGDSRRVLELAFRGAGKSTIAEEYIAIDACFRRFRNFIIVGESATRACERLAAIKHELDFNEHIFQLFGNLHGPVWNEDKIQLTNGAVIQAFGRGQSLRGTKHDDVRPDGCLIDDIEDEESVNTPDGRDKALQWVMRTLLPALDPRAKVRMLANMLDPDCLAVRLKKTGRWVVREYPWEYVDPATGERRATWASRFPLGYIDQTRQEYVQAGMLNEYQQEYMVEAVDPSTRVFTSSMFKVEAKVRTWEPTYAMYDPARTVKKTSAHTGKVVFSWIGTKLVVWEAEGELWMPDQIIADVFKTQEMYQPVKIGMEKDGLEEFLLQPLRAEQTRRHQIIPVTAMTAPVGKLAFIRSLQPFFTSAEIVFAKPLPVLQQQLLSFPTGRIDVPNALAYALRMRPGLPIYDNFGFKNVVDDLAALHNTTFHLALGATRQFTTGVLLQLGGGTLRILCDWVREGDPGNTLAGLLGDARLEAGGRVNVYAGPQHWNTYDAIGLQAAAKRAMCRLSTGGNDSAGREELRRRIDAQHHGQPDLVVSTRARWTLNAFAGGYAAAVIKGKEVTTIADDGIYKVLMEGLESFAAALGGAMTRDGEDTPNYAVDAKGRKYLSARAQHEHR